MKLHDEYQWAGYNKEYFQQLNEMKADGQEFFIKTAPVNNSDGLSFFEKIHNNWKAIYNEAFQLKPSSVFECGCGAGYHLKNIHFLLPGIEISGCDLLQAQIELAKEFSDLPYSIIKNLSVQDLSKPIQPEKQYEFVFSQAVIMHLNTENAVNFLQNMARLSSKYIFLIEGEKNHENWYELVQNTLPEWSMTRKKHYVENAILLEKKQVQDTQVIDIMPVDKTFVSNNKKSFLITYNQAGRKFNNAIDVEYDDNMTAKEKYKKIKEALFSVIPDKRDVEITGLFLLP